MTVHSVVYIDCKPHHNTAIERLVFVGIFSYRVGRTGNPAYAPVLIVLGFGEMWTLVALAVDLREFLSSLTSEKT
jgi:hypothetical protein